jgi:hypothetical protein
LARNWYVVEPAGFVQPHRFTPQQDQFTTQPATYTQIPYLRARVGVENVIASDVKTSRQVCDAGKRNAAFPAAHSTAR